MTLFQLLGAYLCGGNSQEFAINANCREFDAEGMLRRFPNNRVTRAMCAGTESAIETLARFVIANPDTLTLKDWRIGSAGEREAEVRARFNSESG